MEKKIIGFFKKNYFEKSVNLILIILSLNLLTRTLLISTTSFSSLITLFLLFGFLIYNIPFVKLIKGFKTDKSFLINLAHGTIFIILSIILLILTKTQFLWLIAVPILIIGLDIILKPLRIKKAELKILTIASFIYSIFFIFIQSIPQIWYIFQQSSIILSGGVGLLIGKQLSFGPTVSGLWIFIIFIIFSISLFYLGRKKKLFVKTVISMFILWILFISLLGLISFDKTEALNLHLLLFILLLIPAIFYMLKTETKYTKILSVSFKNFSFKKFIKNVAVWSVLLLLISVFLVTSFPNEGLKNQEQEKTVLFYGQNMLGDWSVPDYTKFGEVASGMFGILPIFLDNSNYKTEILVENKTSFLENNFPENTSHLQNYSQNNTESMKNFKIRYINFTNHCNIIESEIVNSEILENVDIFVVTSINTAFLSEEHNNIWNFVENGGSLLVLGDHTDIADTKEPLNDLLKPVGINYRFDSGLPIDQNFDWETCYQFVHNPVTYKVEHLNEIGISVGATLDISMNSFPMLIGKFGLSDIGDYSNLRANLGDYEYNPGEQIGDVILVSGAYYGEGKVMVFGDTSSFQNTAFSHSGSFVKQVFSWLGNNQSGTFVNIKIVLSLTFLFLSAALFLYTKNKRRTLVFFTLAVFLAIVLSSGFNSFIIRDIETTGNTVYIDSSHIEKFNTDGFEDKSLTGTMINLMRNDYYPFILRDFNREKIENSEILILNAPTKKFTTSEVEFLMDYMKDGGLIVLATGYEDKEASMPILDEFGLDIYDFPLGPVPYVESDPAAYQDQPRFVDSWVIDTSNCPKFKSFYNVSIENEVYHLVTFSPHNRGGIILIGDSEFLYDKNIESIENFWPGNIQFIKNLIDEMKEREVL